MPGVYHAVVKKADARATIWHMNQDVSISSLVNTIENLGFTAELDIDRSIPDAMLHIEGMMCQVESYYLLYFI